MTAAMRPSPASCSESSSAPTPRSTSTTARPSPRYTAARRAERCSFESISLCVVLRCQAQAVAHHPRREKHRLASASPASCAGAGSVDVTGRPGTSVRRNASPESPVSCPDPRGAAGDRIPPRRTSPRSLTPWGRFRFTFPKPRRQAAAPVRGGATPRIRGRLSAAADCGEPTVRWSPAATATGGRRDYRNRGIRTAPSTGS